MATYHIIVRPAHGVCMPLRREALETWTFDSYESAEERAQIMRELFPCTRYTVEEVSCEH